MHTMNLSRKLMKPTQEHHKPSHCPGLLESLGKQALVKASAGFWRKVGLQFHGLDVFLPRPGSLGVRVSFSGRGGVDFWSGTRFAFRKPLRTLRWIEYTKLVGILMHMEGRSQSSNPQTPAFPKPKAQA